MKTETLKQYLVYVRHDGGEIRLTVSASDEPSAIQSVMNAEKCPRRSILRVDRIFTRPESWIDAG